MEFISTNKKVPKSLSNKYNSSEVKAALQTECRNKCMYCESIIGHIAFEHIEHIKPKARNRFPKLTFEYSNMGLACPKCNMNKGDSYYSENPYINPYEDDPSEHFASYGAWIWANSGNQRASITELEIELNRPSLIEKRGGRIKAIKELVYKFNETPEGGLKSALKNEIAREIADSTEYSFCVRNLVQNLME